MKSPPPTSVAPLLNMPKMLQERKTDNTKKEPGNTRKENIEALLQTMELNNNALDTRHFMDESDI